MVELQVGDRVRLLTNYPDDNKKLMIGATGTIICNSSADVFGRCGVCWDENVGGHTCDGTCDEGHGWFVFNKYLEPFDDGDDIEDADFLSVIGGAK